MEPFFKTAKESIKRRSQVFSEEKERQRNLVVRAEKIEVCYKGLTEESTMLMNKQISTPYDCIRHLGEDLMKVSAIAEVNGEPWDMHRPIESDCELKLLHFHSLDPTVANKAFWRSGSFLLGAVIELAFREEIPVVLHSFPAPNVRSGSFVYDAYIGVESWQPSGEEMRQLSAAFARLAVEDLPFERLEVNEKVAKELFKDNQFKMAQIPKICEDHGSITVYRVGEHVDISRGPMISSSSLFGRVAVSSIHLLNSDIPNLFRFQGVAIPKQLMLNHFAWGIVQERSKHLNPCRIPGSQISLQQASIAS
ncbi:large ribosomal subunit protein mL39-like isoform X2 [Artemia franciscana]